MNRNVRKGKMEGMREVNKENERQSMRKRGEGQMQLQEEKGRNEENTTVCKDAYTHGYKQRRTWSLQ